MDEQQLINLIGSGALKHWEYFASGIVGIIIATTTLSWYLSNLIHKKEIRILELQLSHQTERFSQFESIVDQRILILKKEAESLRMKAMPKAESELKETSGEFLDIPAYLRKSKSNNFNVEEQKINYNVENKINEFIRKADFIDNVIKSVILLY